MKRFWKTAFTAVIILCLFSQLLPKESFAAKPKDFRAVWVSSVYGLDYPKQATTEARELMAQADEILDGAKGLGMTAVILQVRPAADALYASEIFPWSKYLTGEQGRAPEGGFDPLSYWIAGAHERGMELHAWINPFRAAVSDADYEQMTEEHPARQHPDWVIRHTDGKYYFNPGIPEVRQMVIRGAEEIVRGYEADGIHLDDYFYPSGEFADDETYQQYGSAFSDVGDWRRNNIDRLVSELHDMTKSCGKEISFGVSPSGIWANASSIATGSDTGGNQSYFSSYADSRKWVQNGWVDYICPQLYWSVGDRLADYRTLTKWWAQTVKGTDVKLYVGLADYRTGNDDPESPWHGIGAITQEIEWNREVAEIVGEVHFSYSSISESPALAAYYRKVYRDTDVQMGKIKLNRESKDAYIFGDNGRFYPEQPLTRAQTAVILVRLTVGESGEKLYDETSSYQSFYSDIAQDDWYASAVGIVSDAGLMCGYENGAFCPQKAITRAEFAMLAFRLEGKIETETPVFSDVSSEHWAAEAIAFTQQKGYLSGYEDGSFRPEQNITRAEAVKVINRMLGRTAEENVLAQESDGGLFFRDVPREHWAYDEIAAAARPKAAEK